MVQTKVWQRLNSLSQDSFLRRVRQAKPHKQDNINTVSSTTSRSIHQKLLKSWTSKSNWKLPVLLCFITDKTSDGLCSLCHKGSLFLQCSGHAFSYPRTYFLVSAIPILTLEKYTTKIYKTLIKCWYSWFQHSQSQWPYMESKQQLVITVSKACIHCVLCFIVWHANIDLVSFALFPKYKES